MHYRPSPIDTSKISLPPDIRQLTERLAENAHDIWAEQRMAEGWRLGAKRDDARKEQEWEVLTGNLAGGKIRPRARPR